MNFNEILELMREFDKSSLNAVKISEGDFSLRLERACIEQGFVSTNSTVQPPMERSKDLPAREVPENTIKVTSPLVGTYYEAPQPGAKPFVTEGQRVSEGEVLCVIEAMKLINEIKSPSDGVVIKINAENGQLMSYGDVIMELSNV